MTDEHDINIRGGGILSATSLVVTAALAYAIETGHVSWSWWWLVATGAPFALTVLSTTGALVGIGALIVWLRRQ